MQNIKNYKKVDPTVEKRVLQDYILLKRFYTLSR